MYTAHPSRSLTNLGHRGRITHGKVRRQPRPKCPAQLTGCGAFWERPLWLPKQGCSSWPWGRERPGLGFPSSAQPSDPLPRRPTSGMWLMASRMETVCTSLVCPARGEACNRLWGLGSRLQTGDEKPHGSHAAPGEVAEAHADVSGNMVVACLPHEPRALGSSGSPWSGRLGRVRPWLPWRQQSDAPFSFACRLLSGPAETLTARPCPSCGKPPASCAWRVGSWGLWGAGSRPSSWRDPLCCRSSCYVSPTATSCSGCTPVLSAFRSPSTSLRSAETLDSPEMGLSDPTRAGLHGSPRAGVCVSSDVLVPSLPPGLFPCPPGDTPAAVPRRADLGSQGPEGQRLGNWVEPK